MLIVHNVHACLLQNNNSMQWFFRACVCMCIQRNWFTSIENHAVVKVKLIFKPITYNFQQRKVDLMETILIGIRNHTGQSVYYLFSIFPDSHNQYIYAVQLCECSIKLGSNLILICCLVHNFDCIFGEKEKIPTLSLSVHLHAI